jgi:hypothetical protein
VHEQDLAGLNGSGAADRLVSEVIAIPVADLPPTTLALGWLPEASRPEIVSFARSVKRIAADRGSTQVLRELTP